MVKKTKAKASPMNQPPLTKPAMMTVGQMSDHVGTWGLYPWFREHGTHLIHLDDLSDFESLGPYCKVFICEGEQSGYLVLRYDQKRYRVKPDMFEPVAAPKCSFGEDVSVMKQKQLRRAKVSGIIWHYKRQEPGFYLESEGKKWKKQYWASDFQ